MAPLSAARRKEACELVIIAKCDGIDTLNSRELRLVKRYMQEIGVESLEEAYKQALEEKKAPEDQEKPRRAKEKNSTKLTQQTVESDKQSTTTSKFLTDWPEGSFDHFKHPLQYEAFADMCKANPNRVTLFKKDLTRHTASCVINRIKCARLKAFKADEGHFEARILLRDESYSVYVKYVPQKAA